MKKFIAIVSSRDGLCQRFVAASRDKFGDFVTAALPEAAFVFSSPSEAERIALDIIRARQGKAFGGGLTNYVVRQVSPVSPEIVKTPEEDRRCPKVPRPTLRASAFLEAYDGAAEKKIPKKTCPSFDWKGDGDELYAALAAIIDSIDYTNQACRPNEPVGGVLDRVLIEHALDKLSRWRNQCYKYAATANPEAFGPSDA